MSNWVAVKEYAALFLAELDKQMIEQSGIPVMLKGPLTGAFGPGFAGPTTQGVTLLVPEPHYEAAAELLGESDAGSSETL
ncbi:MAG TPA: hypothetical protein VK933_03465 [Longimicrobiales bacterium]|nr:hypothetical protein [Longimicrobiales bacterium]